MFNAILAGASLLAGLYSPLALADAGHNHDAPAAVAAAPALPRLSAASELFEIVATANGTQLSLYLDRFADNAPVAGATLEVSVGDSPVAMKEVAPGEFEGTLAQALRDGVTPVMVTVDANGETDLLAADFDVHAEAAGAHAHDDARAWLPWGLAALVLLVLTVAGLWLRRGSLARHPAGGAA